MVLTRVRNKKKQSSAARLENRAKFTLDPSKK